MAMSGAMKAFKAKVLRINRRLAAWAAVEGIKGLRVRTRREQYKFGTCASDLWDLDTGLVDQLDVDLDYLDMSTRPTRRKAYKPIKWKSKLL